MSPFQKSVLALAFLSLLSACEVEKVQRTQHDGEVTKEKNLPPEKPASKEDFNSIDLNAIHTNLMAAGQKKGTPESIATATSTVDQLGPIILNNNYIQDPTYLASNRTRVMLSYFNLALLELLETKNPKADAFLDKYHSLVIDGCNAELKGCRNIGFFKQDNRSSNIMVHFAKQLDAQLDKVDQDLSKVKAVSNDPKEKEDYNKKIQSKMDQVKSFYNILALSFELKNAVKDQDLEFLYLKRARDYAQLFQNLKEDERIATRDLYRRHGAVFENIVNNYPADVKSARFKEFVTRFKPWSYSRLEADPFPFGTRRMFSYAATNYLYENKVLTKDLQESIRESQLKEDKFGPSFTQIVADIQTKYGVPFIFKAMEVNPDEIQKADFFDEYFFMIDRLYRGHLDIQEVSEIWKGSTKDADRMVTKLEYYMKVQVLDKIVKTNQYMASIVAQPDMNSETLIRQTIERSKVISDQWRDMLSRFNSRLGTFLGTELRNSSRSEAALRRANAVLDSMKRNIKYLSVYPNMFLMTYYVQDLKAELTIDSFFGQFKIEPKDIINYLFAGKISPWFSFGNDAYPLNKIEMLYAYYFSLATGSFETYGSAKGKVANGPQPVDRKLFFKKVVRQYLSEDKVRLSDAIQEYRKNRESNDYSNLVQYCGFLKSGKTDFSVSLPMHDFIRYSSFGAPNYGLIRNFFDVYRMASHGPDTILGVYYRAGYNSHSETVTGLESKLLLLQSMVDILIKDMKARGFPQNEVDEMKKVTDEEVQNIETLQMDYHNEVVLQHRQANDCIHILLEFERKRQLELLYLEKDHLERVYDLISNLRGKAGAEAQKMLEEAAPKLGFEKGLDSIQGDTYMYNRLNMILRMKRRSEDMKPSVQVELPSEVMKDSSAKDFKAISTVDSQGQRVSKESFVRSAMTYYKNNNSAFLSWLAEMSNIQPLIEKLSGMSELYRFARSQGLPADKSINAEELVRESIEIMSYINIRRDDSVADAKARRDEEQLLRMIGEQGRVNVDELQKIIITESYEPRGVLDRVYDDIADRAGVFAEGNSLYLTLENRQDFLFKPDKTIEQMIRSRYVPFVQKNDRLVREFNEKVIEQEKKLQANQKALKSIVYKLENGTHRTFSLKDTAHNNELVLISPMKRNDIESKFYEFHRRRTGGFFLETKK